MKPYLGIPLHFPRFQNFFSPPFFCISSCNFCKMRASARLFAHHTWISGISAVSTPVFYSALIHRRSYGIWLRSVCYLPNSIVYLIDAFTGYVPLILIFFLNFHLLSVARRQRKRILAETTIASADNFTEQSTNRMSFVLRFFVVLKEAKTFAVVVAVLTICILTPTVVGRILLAFRTDSCMQIWYVVFHFELYRLNSIVNAFICAMRHGKYRKAYVHILFKLFSCHKTENFYHCLSLQSTTFFVLIDNFPHLGQIHWESRSTSVSVYNIKRFSS